MSRAILVTIKPTFMNDRRAIRRLFDAVERKLGASVPSVGMGLALVTPLIREAYAAGVELRLRMWVEDGRVRSERLC